MSTKLNNNSSKSVWFACGLLFFIYAGCCHYVLTYDDNKPKYIRKPTTEITKPKYTSNIDSGQRTRKVIKRIRIIPTTETYEVSRWITSGDWSHDDDPLTVTIPSHKVVMDIDYVEDHWDDYLADPEDEIQYPPEIFQ